MSDDVVCTNPEDEFNALEDLLVHVEQLQQRMPRAYFRLNKLLFHHEQVLTEWTLYKSDGTPLRTAHTYGLFHEQGRLQKLTGFSGPAGFIGDGRQNDRDE